MRGHPSLLSDGCLVSTARIGAYRACRVASFASGAWPSRTPTGMHPNLRRLMTCRFNTPLADVLRPLQGFLTAHSSSDTGHTGRSRAQHGSLQGSRGQAACQGKRGTLSKATLATRPSSVQSSAVACWVSALHAHCDMSTATTLPARCDSHKAHNRRNYSNFKTLPWHA